MPRVEIGTPDQFLFSMEKAVGISDLNYAKHLDSVAMLKILNEARLQFLAHLGFSEANVFGLGMVVADQAVDFRYRFFSLPFKLLLFSLLVLERRSSKVFYLQQLWSFLKHQSFHRSPQPLIFF